MPNLTLNVSGMKPDYRGSQQPALSGLTISRHKLPLKSERLARDGRPARKFEARKRSVARRTVEIALSTDSLEKLVCGPDGVLGRGACSHRTRTG
jgi:hypothetical protein